LVGKIERGCLKPALLEDTVCEEKTNI